MFRRTILLLIILCSISISVQAQTLGWSTISGTIMRNVCPINNYAGSGYNFHDNCNYVTEAWNSAVWDSTRNRMILWGGGHNDYPGNELYAMDMDTLALTKLNNPGIPTNQGGACITTLMDGTPNSRHTYDQIEYMPNVDKMFVLGGSVTCASGGGTDDTWTYDFGTSAWTKIYENSPNTTAGILVTAYDARIGKVWILDTNGGMFTFDPTNNTYATISNTQSGGLDYHMTASIDPIRHKLVVVGNSGGASNGGIAVYDIGAGSTYVLTRPSTTGCSTLIGSKSPGIVYDPVLDRMVMWNGGNDIYELNMDTYACTVVTYTGGPSAVSEGTFGRFQYVAADNAYVTVNDVDDTAYLLRLSFAAITSFTLTSTGTGTKPFMTGIAFAEGDAPTTITTSLAGTYQVTIKSLWPDSSVKHAIIAGYATLTADTPSTVSVYAASTSPSGTDLTAADIATAAPTASVQCGAIGTVNLSSLLATPFRTWVSGPKMVEAHYRAAVGADATLQVWFHVRLYASGEMWVRAVVENGYLDVATVNKSYVPTVIVNGTTIYSNGGSSLTHYGHTRWSAESWYSTDPVVTPALNTTYLISTKLVPNYWKRNPSASALNGLAQTYAPNGSGGWTLNMGDTGFQNQIGLLPLWDALYVTSSADSRAYKSVLANAKALNSYPMTWSDSTTKVTILPASWSTWTVDGAGQGGENGWSAGTLTWDVAHQGSGGYLAYIITGDFYYLETMADQAALIYLVTTSSLGSGTSRQIRGQTRGAAWAIRTLSQYAGIAPTGDAIAAEYRSLLSSNIDTYKTIKDGLSGVGIGYLYEYSLEVYGDGIVAPWQQHFFMQSLGMGSDLKPLANMTNYNEVRDWIYRGASGILGDSNGFCFTSASLYNIKISNSTSTTPSTWYSTWATVFTNTSGTATCNNTLAGTSGSDPAAASTGYWGNLLPGIAYAVDDEASGASASWLRLTGAANWSSVEGSGFDDTPIFGIVPRGTVTPETAHRARLRL